MKFTSTFLPSIFFSVIKNTHLNQCLLTFIVIICQIYKQSLTENCFKVNPTNICPQNFAKFHSSDHTLTTQSTSWLVERERHNHMMPWTSMVHLQTCLTLISTNRLSTTMRENSSESSYSFWWITSMLRQSNRDISYNPYSQWSAISSCRIDMKGNRTLVAFTLAILVTKTIVTLSSWSLEFMMH